MKSPKVFLLDENADSHQATLLKLLTLDVQLLCCENVLECIAQHQTGQAGCIVVSGHRVEQQVDMALAAIAQAAVLLPVIAISRNPRLAFTVAAVKRGAADFLEESVPADVLGQSVMECLDRSLRLSTHMQEMQSKTAATRIAQLSAEELQASVRASLNLRRSGMRKLGVKSRAELHRVSSVVLQSRPMIADLPAEPSRKSLPQISPCKPKSAPNAPREQYVLVTSGA